MKGLLCKKALAVACALLVLDFPARPQAAAISDEEFTITALQGDGATHFVNHPHFETPAVRVTAGGRPLKGVQVTFQLPESGPSGSFQGEHGRRSSVFVTSTAVDGKAEARSFRPNKESGAYILKVTAEQGDRSASAELSQANAVSDSVAKNHKTAKKIWIAVAIVGVAAAVGAIFVASRLHGVGIP